MKQLKLLIFMPIFFFLYTGGNAQDFDLVITVTDGTNNRDLVFGVDPSGTDGYDDGLDVYAPPLPPSPAFGALLEYNYESYYNDIRDNSITEKSTLIRYQAGSGGSIVLNWDSTGLKDLGSFRLVDYATNGTLFDLDMTTTNTLDVSSPTIINSRIRLLVTPADNSTVSDSTTVGAGASGPIRIGDTDITVSFTDGPGGQVVVVQSSGLPPGLSADVVAKLYALTSDMENFTFTLDLRIDYTDAAISGLDENALTIAFLDTIDSIWFALDSVTVFPDDNYIMAYGLTHFTGFAVGESQVFSPLQSFANIRIFLDGVYASGSMSTALRENGYLPLTQPYSGTPWNYNGTESVAVIPAGVVDWVLVELRYNTGEETIIKRRATFLLSDGRMVDLDGTSDVVLNAVVPGDYYVVVHHRGHLVVMGNEIHRVRQEPTQFDFTNDLNLFYGADAREIETGVYGMYGGDANGDGFINAGDANLYWRPTNGTVGYQVADFNGDGFVNAGDKNLIWRVNNGKADRVP